MTVVGGSTRQPAPDRPAPLPLVRGGVLDGLRFLAAFCMVVYHFSFCSPTPLAQIHPLFGRGYLATDFFLIVSGYVLGRIYGPRVAGADIGVVGFFGRRAQRLVPAHLIMIALFVALVAATGLLRIAPQHPEFLKWGDLPAELFLVQAYGVPGGIGWNSPTWSLSALLGCYALFPLVWRAQARISRPLVVLALAVGVMLAADAASWLVLKTPIYEFPSKFGVGRAVPLFLLGAALARVSQTRFIAPPIAVVMTVGAAAALIAVQFVGRFDLASVALISVMVLGAGAIPARRPSHILEKAALISFAVFITNEFVRTVYVGVLHALSHGRAIAPPAAWASWWAALAAAIVFAVGFHYLVDMPTQGWIRGVRRRGRRSTGPVGAEASTEGRVATA